MLLVCRKWGQLGNRLFQFAHLIAFAEEYGQVIVNPSFEDYSQHFCSTSSDVLCRYPRRTSFPRPGRRKRRACFAIADLLRKLVRFTPRALLAQLPIAYYYVEDFKQIQLDTPECVLATRTKRVIFVDGFRFQCSSLVKKHSDKIRAYFAPLPAHQERVNQLVEDARAGHTLLIGVHIRLGDFRVHDGGKYYFAPSVYARIMAEASRLFPNESIRFLVCSNEALDLTEFQGSSVTLGTGHIVEDLYALAQCDYLIGTISTYVGWASFYGQTPCYLLQEAHHNPQLSDFLPIEEWQQRLGARDQMFA